MTMFWIGFAIIPAYLVLHFWIGWQLAKQDLPNAWERARDRWVYDSIARESVRERTIVTVLFWPFIAPIREVRARFHAAVDAGDPREKERELAAREAEIQRMERELGIGGAR